MGTRQGARILLLLQWHTENPGLQSLVGVFFNLVFQRINIYLLGPQALLITSTLLLQLLPAQVSIKSDVNYDTRVQHNIF